MADLQFGLFGFSRLKWTTDILAWLNSTKPVKMEVRRTINFPLMKWTTVLGMHMLSIISVIYLKVLPSILYLTPGSEILIKSLVKSTKLVPPFFHLKYCGNQNWYLSQMGFCFIAIVKLDKKVCSGLLTKEKCCFPWNGTGHEQQHYRLKMFQLIIGKNRGCRRSPVDLFVPSILPPQVRIPSTPSMLLFNLNLNLNCNMLKRRK